MNNMINKTSSNYIFSIIHEIESKIPVKNWILNDIYVWPILRLQLRPIVFEILRDRSVTQNNFSKKNISLTNRALSKIIKFFRVCTRFPFKNVLKQHNAILFSDGCSLDCIEGVWSDKFFRLIEEQLKDHGYNTVMITPVEVSVKPLKSPMHDISFVEIGVEMLTSLRIRFPSKKVNLEDYEGFLEILNRYKIPLKYFTYKEILFKSYKIFLIEKVFAFVLGRIKPRIAMIVSYYHDLGFAFNRACKKLNIPTVEIQHGTQGGVHDAYNHWRQVPATGYPELPSLFWTWTEEDAVEIARWGTKTQGAHSAFIGGNPVVDFWISKNRITQAYDDKIESIKNRMSKKENMIDILVTLQPVKVFQPCWDMLAEVIQYQFGNVRWWIRSHPTTVFGKKIEGMDKILALQGSCIDMQESSSLPLGALLRHVDLHITVRSSTCLEARSFGIKTLFISNLVESEHTQFIKNGDGFIIEDKTAIIQYLKNYTPDKKMRVQREPIKAVEICLAKVASPND